LYFEICSSTSVNAPPASTMPAANSITMDVNQQWETLAKQ
jgi:hypothetical protein